MKTFVVFTSLFLVVGGRILDRVGRQGWSSSTTTTPPPQPTTTPAAGWPAPAPGWSAPINTAITLDSSGYVGGASPSSLYGATSENHGETVAALGDGNVPADILFDAEGDVLLGNSIDLSQTSATSADGSGASSNVAGVYQFSVGTEVADIASSGLEITVSQNGASTALSPSGSAADATSLMTIGGMAYGMAKP